MTLIFILTNVRRKVNLSKLLLFYLKALLFLLFKVATVELETKDFSV